MDNTFLSKTGEEYSTDQSNCQTSSPNYLESLPVDVIFEILLRVPAQDIHNWTRLVCRKWYKITQTRNFKHAHLHQSTFGLLAYEYEMSLDSDRHKLTFIATGSKVDDLIEISKTNYRSQHDVLSSFNGLVLASRDIPRFVYITNPVTEQILDLPPFYSKNMLFGGSAISYVPTTMEYKEVRAFIKSVSKPQDDCVAILTVGVDKDWTRRVNTQNLYRQAKKLLSEHFPLTTQGFVHWARDEGMVYWAQRPGCVLTLNIETESIKEFLVPSLRLNDIGIYTEVIYLPMGSYLSMLILRSEFSWEFWEMNPETGEWTEMPSIDLEDQFVLSRSYILKPVGWLRPREVLFFSVGERSQPSRFASYHPTPFCFAFTVRTRKLQKFELDEWMEKYFVHRNSLVCVEVGACF